MTHFKFQRFKFFVFLSIFLLLQVAVCNDSVNKKRENTKSVPLNNTKSALSDKQETAPKESYAQNNENSLSDNSLKNATVNITSKMVPELVKISSPTTSTAQLSNGLHIPSINSGALMRGIFVVVGLGVIVMAYMVFRTFMLNKTRPQMVRKYGVLAHRQDVEMRPLPLDEDDDDDTTVFDASNISSHRLQS